ncbi:hypothetical protein BV22DRAFT_1028675 [Leucogyrophana mollusca]|uniref:Uncharacterized protein n=1 Tax=Leucogyrophana mollusca TaxID=85980 RepID=A0ACB8BZ75_9AGAM|nr:hypothetical protein BV22DRAFT_1028675 [Leucogyrophana mollusca]
MPTATATTTATTVGEMSGHSVLPLKAGLAPPESAVSTPIDATLRSLYNRAARAFLHREVLFAFTLMNSAFSMLHPPTTLALDSLESHRRKWDILRITLETTVYSSPPDLEKLPSTLRANMLLSPQSLITSLHTRSLTLFTPSPPLSQPNSAFLPHQVLVTLAASSLKVDCPEVGRGMIEEWLSKRGQYDVPPDPEAYQKVLELYCLHILPRLGEWDYVNEFLQYESELPPEKKHDMQVALRTLQAKPQPQPQQVEPAPKLQPDASMAAPPLPRSPSPAASTSSSASSLSTMSNRTAVPLSRIEPLAPHKLERRHSVRSSASIASDATITRRTSRAHRTPTPRASPSASVVRSLRPPRAPLVASPREPPGTLTLIRASLGPYFSANKLTALSIFFLLLPLISILFRIRRRRAAAGTESAADHVRRKLLEARGDSPLRRLWNEVIKAIVDTVRMGGGGLV